MTAGTLLIAMVAAAAIQALIRLNVWYWLELTPEERAEAEDDPW